MRASITQKPSPFVPLGVALSRAVSMSSVAFICARSAVVCTGMSVNVPRPGSGLTFQNTLRFHA